MSTEKSFNRLDDRPEARDRDRFGNFKAKTSTLLEYREAYLALKRSNPEAVKGLPDPDGDPKSFDPQQALDSIRRLRGGLKTDPAVDLKS
jgi:hypothetical protein